MQNLEAQAHSHNIEIAISISSFLSLEYQFFGNPEVKYEDNVTSPHSTFPAFISSAWKAPPQFPPVSCFSTLPGPGEGLEGRVRLLLGRE
jgi:hypothetical protein